MNEFDIVIIDAGSNIESGLTIGALNSSKHRFLVTTQQESSINNYKLVKEQILQKLNINDFMLIINKYINLDDLYNPYQLSKQYEGSTFVSSLPLLNWGWQSEKDKKTLLHYDDKDFVSSIDKIANIIASQVDEKYETDSTEKTTFFNKVFKVFK